MSELNFEDLKSAYAAVEDLIGILQDLKHRIESAEDFDEYGLVDSLIEHIESALIRYDALD